MICIRKWVIAVVMLAVLGVSAVLAGCGQKGPLYLPDDQQQEEKKK